MARYGLSPVCVGDHCARPTMQRGLCDDCTQVLAGMLEQLPWLLNELEARIQKLDRVNLGTVGRTRRQDTMNAVDFDAAALARKIRKKLLGWVEIIAEQHTGRKPPALHTVSTKHLAAWLHVNVEAAARLPISGELYKDIDRIVGASQAGGQLVDAINPSERHLAGPCPTVRAHGPDGEDIACGRMLYARSDERTTVCPDCGQSIDVEKNRDRAIVEKDLLPVPKLLEALQHVGEPVSRVKLYQWIREHRIRPRGWLHNGTMQPFRIRRGDPAVYSLARARKLRAKEIAKKQLEEAQKQ